MYYNINIYIYIYYKLIFGWNSRIGLYTSMGCPPRCLAGAPFSQLSQRHPSQGLIGLDIPTWVNRAGYRLNRGSPRKWIVTKIKNLGKHEILISLVFYSLIN